MNKYPKWLEVKAPFRVRTEIDVAQDGTVTATAYATSIHDPVGLLKDIKTYNITATAKCHPDDEYDRAYGIRLASNRAQRKFYNYAANRINERLEQLDTYLSIVHNKMIVLDEEREKLLLEQMTFKEPPQED